MEVSKEARNWAIVAHLAGLLSFIGPLIVWLVKKDDDAFVADQALEALNFQITMLIAWVVACMLILVVVGVFLMPLLWLVNVVLVVIASMNANNGTRYRYPFCIRLIK